MPSKSLPHLEERPEGRVSKDARKSMQPTDDLTLDWLRWADFSAPLLYELLQFRQAVFVVEQASAYADLDGRDQRAEHLLLRRRGALIGCLRVTEPDPLARIGRVAVAAAERGHGIARGMMELALQRANEVYPHRDVAVSAQTYLEPFYRSLGFVAVSAPYDDGGIPHIDMVGPPRSG